MSARPRCSARPNSPLRLAVPCSSSSEHAEGGKTSGGNLTVPPFSLRAVPAAWGSPGRRDPGAPLWLELERVGLVHLPPELLVALEAGGEAGLGEASGRRRRGAKCSGVDSLAFISCHAMRRFSVESAR